MSRDVRDAIKEAAHTPTRQIDTDGLWSRARRGRRMKTAVIALVVLGITVGLGAVMQALRAPSEIYVGQQAVDSASCGLDGPQVAAGQERGAHGYRWEIYGNLDPDGSGQPAGGVCMTYIIDGSQPIGMSTFPPPGPDELKLNAPIMTISGVPDRQVVAGFAGEDVQAVQIHLTAREAVTVQTHDAQPHASVRMFVYVTDPGVTFDRVEAIDADGRVLSVLTSS